jgi:hypothetical protein
MYQGFTLTQGISWGLLLCPAFPAQGTVAQSHNVKVSSEVLCPVRRPITTLDCVLLKYSSQVLVAIRGPKINSRACLWVPAGPATVPCAVYPTSNEFSSLYYASRLPGPAPVQQKDKRNPPPLRAHRQFHSRMPGDPKESHRVIGENII